MALISGAAASAVQQFFSDSMQQIVRDIQSGQGISEQDAKDVVANFLIDTAVNAGVIFSLLKLKLPAKMADYFGFTTKGFTKRTLTPTAQKAVATLPKTITTGVLAGLSKKVVIFAASATGLGWLINGFFQIIEPGIYQPAQTNAVYRKLGIPFQYPLNEGQLQPGPFDPQQFKDYANSLETGGITGFEDPVRKGTFLYSRQGLAAIIEYVYAEEVFKGNALSAKEVIPLVAKYLRRPSGGGGSVAVKPTPTPSPYVPTSTKVFVGVVSQGTLGGAPSFVARPDDLISSAQELQDAARNNIASFVASLPSRVVYEIKVVSSITTKDGFTQHGRARTITVGTKQDGTPKTKVVVNKFAVAYLYALTDRNTRTKLTTIVLGPTDAVGFQPTAADLGTLENLLKNTLTTTNPADIGSTVPPQPLAGAPVSSQPTAPASAAVGLNLPKITQPLDNSYFVARDSNYLELYRTVGNEFWVFQPYSEIFTEAEKQAQTQNAGKTDLTLTRLKTLGVDPTGWAVAPFITDIKVDAGRRDAQRGKNFREFFEVAGQNSPTPPTTPNAPIPQTLYEYYNGKDQSLPTVAERATLYQELSLGQAAYYTGTAEQNTKLLAALIARD